MGKVTIDIDQQTHLKLKLICTTKDVKIKDYVEEILTNQIVEDYKQLEIPTQWMREVILYESRQPTRHVCRHKSNPRN